jgi:hypothetical protein
MQLASTFPRPAALQVTPASPSFDLDRDAAALDYLPEEFEYRVNLPISSSAMWGDDGEWPVDNWYAAPSMAESPMRMERTGIRAALAGAETLAGRIGMPVAVAQDPADGTRYLLPLGVWNPVDESELMFEDAGGLPHFTSAADHVLLSRNAAENPIDVEAVVFRDGAASRWINLTGHAVTT